MKISARDIFRLALMGAIVFAQTAASPHPKPAPYNVNLYLHRQRLVNIGGRRLNLICTGSGSPTVILEAGAQTAPLVRAARA